MSDHSPRMLLVAFTPFPAATGAATRVAQRVTSFSDAGYALEVLTPKTPQLPYVSKLAGARLLRVPMPHVRGGQPTRRSASVPLSDRYAAFERAVKRQLTVNEYDVIHTMDPFTGGVVTAQQGHAKLVFEVGGGLPFTDGDEALAAEMRARRRALCQSADLVLVPSDDAAVKVRVLGAPLGAVHVVRPSTALDLFEPPIGGRQRDDDLVRVALTASALLPSEVTVLAEALLHLPRTLKLKVTVSAALTADDALRIDADERLDDRLRLVDPVLYEDLGPLYQEADIGLVLSPPPVRSDLPPVRLQAMAEMMASGLPVVVPDVSAVRECIDHGKEGLLVPPGDAKALAQAFIELAADVGRRRRIGQQARRTAMRQFDERAVASRLLALYGSTMTPTVSLSPSAFLDVSAPSHPLSPVLTPTGTWTGDGPSRPTQPVAMATLLRQLPRARVKSAQAADDATVQTPQEEGPTDPEAALHGRKGTDGMSPTEPELKRIPH